MDPQEDEPPLTLSKWPFYLGDLLLVATGLSIAALGGWNLSDWQVLSCVLAVALGAALLCLPFVFEHWLRVREQSEDRHARLRVAERRMDQLTEAVIALRDELETSRAELRRLEQADEALDGLIERKLAGLKPSRPEADPAVAELRAALERSEGLGSELRARQDGLVARMAELEAEMKKRPEPAPVAAPVDRPRRSPRQPNRPEPRLLHRAIKDRAAEKSGAVSRIIEAKSKSVEATGTPPEASPESPAPASETPAETPAAEAASAEAAPGPASERPETVPDSVPAAEPVPEDRPLPAPKKEALPPKPGPEPPAKPAAEPKPAPKPKPAAPEARAAETTIDLEAEVPAMEPDDLLFDRADLPEKRGPKVRTKKNDSAVTAKVLIGIGNKPFIRGSGGGLSWERGVPMEFESIGSWRWLAPAELDAPLRFRIYRNDQDPDGGGERTLEPGQKLEVEPRFQ